MLGCAKHFPGHGDTSSDSHLDLPVLPHSRERLEQLEFPPFREAIAAGVDSVMTAHLLLPQLDPEQPATLSKAVLTDLLRGSVGLQRSGGDRCPGDGGDHRPPRRSRSCGAGL